MATETRVLRAALGSSSLAARLCPALDIGLVALAAAVWYVRPQEGAWPLALIGVGWLLRFVVYGYLTRSTPFDLPLLLFLASAFLGVNLAFSQAQQWLDSVTPFLWAWAKFWTIVPALALFVAVANLRGVRQVWWFARVYACLAVALTLYFVVTNDWQVRGGKFDLLSQLGALLSEPLPDVPGRRLHPNVVGGVIAMLVPFCLALWCEARARRREFMAWGALTLAALFGLLMSASRGAWLAVAFVALVWALWRELSAGPARSRVRLVVLALVLPGGALLLAAFADLGTVQVSANPGASSVISRIALWQGGLSLVQDYLFTGGGLGAFPMLYSTYVLQVPAFFIAHAHNLWLDIVLDQGLIGLLAFGWLLVLACVLSLRGVRLLAAEHTRRATLARWLLEAAVASLLVTLVHASVDDIAFGSRALLLLFVPFGVMAALYRRFPEMHVHLPWRWLAAGLTCPLLVIALWQSSALLAQWHANLGALWQAQTELGPYHVQDRLPEMVRRDADLTAALGEFNLALSADPLNRTALQRLAMLALARGQYDAARAYVEPLYQRDPSNEPTRQLLGDAYLALGRLDDAYALWSRVGNAEVKLHLEADIRYHDDAQRAAWTLQLADRIRAGR